MRKEKLDFIPKAHAKYIVWLRALSQNLEALLDEPDRSPKITSITSAMVGSVKKMANEADPAVRFILMCKESLAAATKFAEELIRGIKDSNSAHRHTGKITLPPIAFNGFTDYSAGQTITLRRYIREIKADPALTPDDFKRLGIVSASKTYDFNHDQPVLRDPVQLPQGVKIELAGKKGYTAARLYSNTDDGEFSILDTITGCVYHDTRPVTKKTEKRGYFAIYLKDGEEIGLPSAEVVASLRKIT